MKAIKLVGGPNHGEERKGYAPHLVIPVVYEHASYQGEANCRDHFCQIKEPHKHPYYKKNFNRIYQMVYFLIDGEKVAEYHYVREE